MLISTSVKPLERRKGCGLGPILGNVFMVITSGTRWPQKPAASATSALRLMDADRLVMAVVRTTNTARDLSLRWCAR